MDFPSGVIVMWRGHADKIPDGWVLCDGTNQTPDLRGRFVLGASDERFPGSRGGEEKHRLSIDEMPRHSHDIRHSVGPSSYGTSDRGNGIYNPNIESITYVGLSSSSHEGSSAAHNNMPPYYCLHFIMKK